MTISFKENLILINGSECVLPWRILRAIEEGENVYVLLDPNVYLSDPEYLSMLRQGVPSVRNLVAFSSLGKGKWKADLPENSDYYYQIISSSPLIADSFSSYRCEIDSEDGKIRRREFLK